MKQYMTLFALLFALFCTPSVFGQQNKPCNNFDCAYKKAENFLKQAAYQKALDNLDSAEGYLTDTNTKEKEQIKQLRRRLFVAIEKEKEDAKRARDEAKRQTEIAKNAFAQVEIEKQTAIAAEKKAKAVVAVRPERISLQREGEAGSTSGFKGRISQVTFLGDQTEYHLETEAVGRLLVKSSSGNAGFGMGDSVIATWNQSAGLALLDD